MENKKSTMEPEDLASSDTKASEQSLKNSCCFGIFDRVKVKLEATDSFPMDIICQVYLTKEEIEEFETLKNKQEEKWEELKGLVKHLSDGTKI